MKFALTETALGWVGIAIDGGKICASTLPTSRSAATEAMVNAGAAEPASHDDAAPLLQLIDQIAAGEGVDAGVREIVHILGGTTFQRAVWEGVLAIPYGTTISYGELAERIGWPRAARAVGQAVGSNPLPLLIPCHRVAAANGIGGFGGGVALKRALLSQEGVAL